MTTPGLTPDPQVEIISAYAATNQPIPAVAAAPGWIVIGAFFLPTSVTQAQLEAIGGVSDGSLTMNVRLFDLSTAMPISGSLVTIASLADVRQTSGLIDLTGGRSYQIQAQVTGAAGDTFYGTLKTADLI